MRIFFHLLRNVFLRAGFLLWISCDSESSRIGSDFFRNGSLDISSTDTVRVLLSTIKFDSLVTSQPHRTLLGTHQDEKLGRITATTYFKPALANTEALNASNIFFDDLSVVVKYDGYSYYDTTNSQTVHVHQLGSEMEFASDGKLYNTSYFTWEQTRLGSLTFTPGPNHRDSIEIHLDKSFGQNIFSKAVDAAPEFEDNESFQKFMKGFALVPDAYLSSAINGFTPAPELRLYYFDRNVVPAERKYIAFTAAGDFVSTHIFVDRSQTKLKDFPDSRDKLIALQSDNQAYLQAGAGLSLRIDLPHLRNLKQLSNFYVTKSVLQIQPVYKSYGDFTRLPLGLDVFMVNDRNESLGQYSSAAILKEDLSTGRDTHYEIDATAFVKSQMELEEINENGLLLVLSEDDFRSGTDRVYFAAPSSQYNTRLIIYYATIMD